MPMLPGAAIGWKWFSYQLQLPPNGPPAPEERWDQGSGRNRGRPTLIGDQFEAVESIGYQQYGLDLAIIPRRFRSCRYVQIRSRSPGCCTSVAWMADLGRFEEGDYMPDSGLLVVRDTAGGGWAEIDDAHPCGTIVRSGVGWLYAGAGDGPCVVRIEAHLAEPSAEGEWGDLVEVPFRSTTGAVGLTTITMGAGDEQVCLGTPGPYRVRVAHRRLPVSGELPESEDELEPTDLWQLDFWPVDVVEPPCWLRRMTAPVGPLTPGWTSLLPYDVNDIADMVRWNGGADGMSVDELRQWGLEHMRGERWLDDPPFLSNPRPGWPALGEISEQVGLAVPTARRAVLPLMVALGMLTFDGERYRRVDRPPLAQDVLRLSDDVVRFLKESQAVNQFTGFAADLVSVASWGGSVQTVVELAARTLASESDVQGALEYAARRKLLRVAGDPDGRIGLTAGG
jgi:hypothetical protein